MNPLLEKKSNAMKSKPKFKKKNGGYLEEENPVVAKIDEINQNIQEFMNQVISNGHANLEKYSDKLRNIINTLGVENLLNKHQLLAFLNYVRDNFHPK